MIQSEKLMQDEDEDIIKELCASNGVCHEKLSQDGSDITALESLFFGFPRMVGLSLFPRLSSLTIIGQTVEQIQGLDNCPLLTQLWVAECQLAVSHATLGVREKIRSYLQHYHHWVTDQDL